MAFDHPRFGLVPCLLSTHDIEEDEEIVSSINTRITHTRPCFLTTFLEDSVAFVYGLCSLHLPNQYILVKKPIDF